MEPEHIAPMRPNPVRSFFGVLFIFVCLIGIGIAEIYLYAKYIYYSPWTLQLLLLFLFAISLYMIGKIFQHTLAIFIDDLRKTKSMRLASHSPTT